MLPGKFGPSILVLVLIMVSVTPAFAGSTEATYDGNLPFLLFIGFCILLTLAPADRGGVDPVRNGQVGYYRDAQKQSGGVGTTKSAAVAQGGTPEPGSVRASLSVMAL